MGSHWPHWTVQRSLCALAVLNGGVHLPLVPLCLYMYLYFLTFSYKLTVSNGLSLMVWKHIAVTFLSSSFKWGGGHHLSLSHQLTVLNGFSLMVWKCIAVTFSSSSFKWGGRTLDKVGLSATFELGNCHNSFTLFTALLAIQLYMLSFGVELLDRLVIHLLLQNISVNLQLLCFWLYIVVVVVVVYYRTITRCH